MRKDAGGVPVGGAGSATGALNRGAPSAINPRRASCEMMEPAESKLEIACGNCDRPWLHRDERWRSYLDDEGNANLFCPDCASREFTDCDENEGE